ncbi:hypothetical protein ACWDAZ_27205, partial [Streptomyces sp. NPDC001215]
MTTAAEAGTAAVPEVADPSRVAPRDARELSKLFFDQLSSLDEGTPEYQYARPATRSPSTRADSSPSAMTTPPTRSTPTAVRR